MRIMLRLAGYGVRTASGVEAAIASVAKVRPDLILLDDLTPELPGIDVIRTLRANSATASIPIIICTAMSHFDNRTAAFEAGADDVLAMPITYADLLSHIAACLARNSQP